MTVIVLDTNVISEAMKGQQADDRMIAWLRSLPETPVTTVVNKAEILAGIALLPRGARRDRLASASTAAFSTLGVVLPFVPEAADHYADIVAARRHAGIPIGGMDALIAAICLTVDATLATRDVEGFAGVGVRIVDPWAAV